MALAQSHYHRSFSNSNVSHLDIFKHKPEGISKQKWEDLKSEIAERHGLS